MASWEEAIKLASERGKQRAPAANPAVAAPTAAAPVAAVSQVPRVTFFKLSAKEGADQAVALLDEPGLVKKCLMNQVAMKPSANIRAQKLKGTSSVELRLTNWEGEDTAAV